MRNYAPQPYLLDDGLIMEDEPSENLKLNYELDEPDWRPLEFTDDFSVRDWPDRPQRFIDGKDVGRTVAWLQSREGYPVPVRLSEIGAVEMRSIDGQLRREFYVIERVVSLMADLFPWEEIERFAIELKENGFRLLHCDKPKETDTNPGGYTYDFERMRKTTQNRSNDEMARLERQVLMRNADDPTIVDGRLDPRASAFNQETQPIIGLIKTHSRNYLHAQGWRTFYVSLRQMCLTMNIDILSIGQAHLPKVTPYFLQVIPASG